MYSEEKDKANNVDSLTPNFHIIPEDHITLPEQQ